MVQNQDWGEAYKELCDLIKNNTEPTLGIEEVLHVDMWHEQVNYLAEEYPFPPNSVFIRFQTKSITTNANKVQDLNMEITFFFVLDTLADTYQTAETQPLALSFIQTCKKIHKVMQGRSGLNFSNLDRNDMGNYPAPEYLIVFYQTYTTIIRDMSAMDEPGEGTLTGATVNNNQAPGAVDSEPLYRMD